MILLAHPFGNQNVRAVLDAFEQAGLLAKFVTALGWSEASPFLAPFPKKLQRQMARRSYHLAPSRIKTLPQREIARLLGQRLGQEWLIQRERGWANIDRVWGELDSFAADFLRKSYQKEMIRIVYAYEDCALRSFETACEIGVRRVYDLPIAYWETVQRLLQEEAERYPDWAPTMEGVRDSKEKLARKKRELDLAEVVICPSGFVLESLPERIRGSRLCLVAPFGSPRSNLEENAKPSSVDRPLRVLFAGTLTQRKGLADVFAAMKLVRSEKVELVVMGSLLQPLAWYREQFPNFVYEAPRPHRDVLRLMQSCDLLVLPSLVEGRALVQQEAMMCGLPLIVTRNAGGEDLIVEGETGFLVPIRSPEAIAEKLDWFSRNRDRLSGMAIAAQQRASQLTWHDYGEKVIAALKPLLVNESKQH